jgi:hypothetical protein
VLNSRLGSSGRVGGTTQSRYYYHPPTRKAISHSHETMIEGKEEEEEEGKKVFCVCVCVCVCVCADCKEKNNKLRFFKSGVSRALCSQ